MELFKNRPVTLVLSSGGSRGLAQIGAINKLQEYGFNISSVAGSSIGSLIGGLYVMGKLQDYSEWVKTLNRKLVWDLMDFTISSNGLLKGERVFEKMRPFFPDVNIEDIPIPFVVVATDIINKKPVIFNEGSIYEAIRASIALPAVFTPVYYKQTVLVDGGILNPIPVEHAVRLADDLLVVVNLYAPDDSYSEKEESAQSQFFSHSIAENGFLKSITRLIASGEKKSPGYISLLSSTSSAMIHRIANLNIDKHKPDILINIPYKAANTFDFHKADQLIKLGEDSAEEAIQAFIHSVDI
ncbi:patatin-like phospholipase family protein [Marinilabiliaceae bacterium ANBcel2]|nr:patatin-like phospholipase family protein [Marinilabiliaceae bacterium ANBcel2]